MADQSVRMNVTGLIEFRNALNKVSADIARGLSAGYKRVAQSVVADVQRKIPRTSTPKHPAGQAAWSVKAQGIQSGASIVWGGQAAPYLPWLDFGGTVGRGHKGGRYQGAIVRQWRGKDVQTPAGRYMYPTVSAHTPQTAKMLDDLIADSARAAGFETSGGL